MIVIGELMLIVDTTIVNVALPSMQQELGFSSTGLSWVIDAFAVTFGGLLLLGGRVGDVFGRRTVFIVGLMLFAVSSFLGGFANSAGWLIGSRVGQGVGAALAGPSTLALLTTNFREGSERNRALSVYSAVTGSGMALGLILGGALVTWQSWRWVMFINFPIGVAAAILAPWFVRESDRNPGSFDLLGAVLSTAGMTGFVFGLIHAASAGWNNLVTVGSLAMGILLLAAFVFVEGRTRSPLTPLSLFTDRNRGSGYATMLLVGAMLAGTFFFLTQFIQRLLGFGPLAAGMAFLPVAGVMFVTAPLAGRLLTVMAPKAVVAIGTSSAAGAMVWLSTLSTTSTYWGGVLGPLVLFGGGAGLILVPLNGIIMSGLPPQHSGAGAGLLQAAQQIGAALGLAALVTVFGATVRGKGGSPANGSPDVVVGGMGNAFALSALFTVVALLLVSFVMKRGTARN